MPGKGERCWDVRLQKQKKTGGMEAGRAGKRQRSGPGSWGWGAVGLSSSQPSFTMWTGWEATAGGVAQSGFCRAGNPTPRVPLPGPPQGHYVDGDRGQDCARLYVRPYLTSRSWTHPGDCRAPVPGDGHQGPSSGTERFWPRPRWE